MPTAVMDERAVRAELRSNLRELTQAIEGLHAQVAGGLPGTDALHRWNELRAGLMLGCGADVVRLAMLESDAEALRTRLLSIGVDRKSRAAGALCEG